MKKYIKKYDEIENIWVVYVVVLNERLNEVLGESVAFETENMADLILFCLERRIK